MTDGVLLPQAPTASPWLYDLKDTTQPSTATVLMLPHAGGSSHVLAALAQELPLPVRVLAGQYPGRGPRTAEPFVKRLSDLVEPLAEAIDQHVPGPLVVFGHSLGAMVGWQLVRLLESRGRDVQGFMPASCNPPHVARPAGGGQVPLQKSDEVLAYLRRLGGLPEEVLDEPELLELVLDVVRADFALTQDYPTPGRVERIACPVMAIGGGDDTEVPSDQLPRWADCTSQAAGWRILSGGHFFYQEHLAEIAELLVSLGGLV
ncbi:alpha/beta fold hydrolase [Streptomyces sp. NPDC004546]|uniref:thioesterase II family protein n=1 Tax=unclassified Streptomyces TaxID=2593676 RepID=UPI0033A46EBC